MRGLFSGVCLFVVVGARPVPEGERKNQGEARARSRWVLGSLLLVSFLFCCVTFYLLFALYILSFFPSLFPLPARAGDG